MDISAGVARRATRALVVTVVCAALASPAQAEPTTPQTIAFTTYPNLVLNTLIQLPEKSQQGGLITWSTVDPSICQFVPDTNPDWAYLRSLALGNCVMNADVQGSDVLIPLNRQYTLQVVATSGGSAPVSAPPVSNNPAFTFTPTPKTCGTSTVALPKLASSRWTLSFAPKMRINGRAVSTLSGSGSPRVKMQWLMSSKVVITATLTSKTGKRTTQKVTVRPLGDATVMCGAF